GRATRGRTCERGGRGTYRRDAGGEGLGGDGGAWRRIARQGAVDRRDERTGGAGEDHPRARADQRRERRNDVKNSDLQTRIEQAAAYVRSRTKTAPETGIILGTGLGDFADALQVDAVIPYKDIPGFPVSTVESHAGE